MKRRTFKVTEAIFTCVSIDGEGKKQANQDHRTTQNCPSR